MDLATIIGLVIGVALLGASMSMGAGGIVSFIDIPSILVVIGGISAAILIMFPLAAIFGSLTIAMKTFLVKPQNANEIINKMIQMAAVVRKDGVLALEKEKSPDPFMDKAIRLLIEQAC